MDEAASAGGGAVEATMTLSGAIDQMGTIVDHHLVTMKKSGPGLDGSWEAVVEASTVVDHLHISMVVTEVGTTPQLDRVHVVRFEFISSSRVFLINILTPFADYGRGEQQPYSSGPAPPPTTSSVSIFSRMVYKPHFVDA